MGTMAFRAKVAVFIEGREHELTSLVTDDTWQLKDARTQRISEKTIHVLQQLYIEGKLLFDAPRDELDASPGRRRGRRAQGKVHRDIKPELMDAAKVRRAYALAATDVLATEEELKKVAVSTWLKLGMRPERVPHWTSVYRWRQKLQASGRDILSLVVEEGKRGNRAPRYPAEVIWLVEEAVESVYLTRERKTIQDVIDSVHHSINTENKLRVKDDYLPLPKRRLVQSMVAEVPAFDRCMARHGRDVAVRRFRAVLGSKCTRAPLQKAQIDHTVLDLMVLDDKTGLPLGRPVLTVCIDDFSRCVLGINIGFEPPSYLTVARCLKHAFRPKVDLKSKYPEIVNEWLAHGVMRDLVMDNGLEFHSTSLEAACLSLGIDIHYSPRKQAWFKGKVERFQGTLNREVSHTAPGTTFSNIFEKDEYDPLAHAVVRLSVLQEVVRKWIVDVYHQRPHRALKVPPAEVWKSSIGTDDIELPGDPQTLDAILGRREQRVLSVKGIELDSLFYNSPELVKLRADLGERLNVEICIDDGDIGSIIVLSPDKKTMFTVPAVSIKYAKGLTRWQHTVCKRFDANNAKQYNSAGWLEAKQRIAQIISNEAERKKSTRRANRGFGRFQEGTEVATVPLEGSPSALPPTRLEAPPARQAVAVAKPIVTTPAPVVPALRQGPSSPTAHPRKRFAPVVRERSPKPAEP